MTQEAGAEESGLRSYASGSDWQRRSSDLSWGELLKYSLVVLLGEPGSGKTYELQYQAAQSSQGFPRFYLRLDEMAEGGEPFCLLGDDAVRFTEWRDSSSRAVFLLDSVDEAKIRKATDFYRALDRFVALVGHRALTRATIVISSRITEWIPTIDGHEVRVRFPRQDADAVTSRKGRQLEQPHPFVVQLLPLHETAVTTYAKARGVADAPHFLEALEKAHAWELARRPADVNDLLAFWRESGSLGTLTEILAFVCESQLRKTSDRERIEVLALERAQNGAQCLAAATVLCRKFIFQIPGETNAGVEAIDGLACLPADWRNEEVRALLNHALFDGASYGHIRFHHRRLSEFLAARWLEDLMAKGCPVGDLEDLLFDARSYAYVLRPSVAPLAAWLCAGAGRWNTMVCHRVIEVAPEILLRYGDPAALTVEDRRALLKALMKNACGREHLWWEHDQATLSRLADEALIPEINDLMTAPSAGHSLRELGLEIVIAGKLTDCAPTILKLAIADLANGDIFPTVARALTTIGRESDLRTLAMAAERVGRLPERVCMPLCGLLFPSVWSITDLFCALNRMHPVARRGRGWDYIVSDHIASATTQENGLALLNGFLGNSSEDGDEDDEFDPPLSLRTALAISGVMLAWSNLSEEEASAIAEVFVKTGRRRPHYCKDEGIFERTERHPQVRERYFRLAAERLAREHKCDDVRFTSVVIFHEVLKPTLEDLSWVLVWLKSATSDVERQRALEWSLDLWQQLGRPSGALARIRVAAREFADTRRMLWKYLHPGFFAHARAFWYRRIRYRSYRYRLRRAWQEIRQPFLKLRATWNLWRHREKMRAGGCVGWLADLAAETYDKSRDQWSPGDWSLLEAKRGAKCAAAVKEGCKRVWERYEPPLPYERSANDGVTYGTLAGLAGIKVAWQEGQLIFADLSFEDARRATRYALCELNGFAPWFEELIQVQPRAVGSLLIECIAGEWEIPAESEHHHLVIYDLAWTGSAACGLIKQEIMDRLAVSDPRNFHVLRDALCIAVTPPSPQPETLASVVERRCNALGVCDLGFPLWMALWLQVDAPRALDALESRLSSARDSAQAMSSICANLSCRAGYRLPLLPNPSWRTPAAMRRFIPLVYRYVNRENDIDRSGGEGYSPTARDDAQDFRGGLLEMLVATGDSDVGGVIRELMSEPLLSHLVDYMRHLLEKHREQMAEGRPWRSSDIRMFAASYEREPQTDDDLFRIGIKRLFDLKRWVEAGEDSPRREVHLEDNEAGFRDWLRRKLNDTARRYVVAPEWEIVNGRPDLRLVVPNAAPVSLELKIADNWTLQELLNGLEEQLIGIYLHDDRARFGIYVLALFNRARKWCDGESRIDSGQMLGVLRKRIKETLAARPDIAGIEVVLIHLSPPARQ